MTGSIRPSLFLSGKLEDIFYCWVRKPLGGGSEEFAHDDPSKYWNYGFKEQSYTDFSRSAYVKPKDLITVSLRSRDLFEYGQFELRAKLPRAPTQSGPILWFGFELDDLFAGGVAHFAYWTGTDEFKGFCGASAKHLELDLTNFLPADHAEAKHWYKVQVTERAVLWYIDGDIRGIGMLSAGAKSSVLYGGPPFALGVCGDLPSRKLPVLLDVDGGGAYSWDGLNPWDLRVSSGFPRPALSMSIGDAEGPWAQRAVGGGLTSYPMPGFGQVSAFLQGDGEGRAELQASDDGENWRTLDAATGDELWLEGGGAHLVYRVRYHAISSRKIAKALFTSSPARRKTAKARKVKRIRLSQQFQNR